LGYKNILLLCLLLLITQPVLNYTKNNINFSNTVYYRLIYSIPYYLFDTNNTSQNYIKSFTKSIGCENYNFKLYRFINGNGVEILTNDKEIEECLFKENYEDSISAKNKFNYIINQITLIRKYNL
jgi:hypothetical protein